MPPRELLPNPNYLGPNSKNDFPHSSSKHGNRVEHLWLEGSAAEAWREEEGEARTY